MATARIGVLDVNLAHQSYRSFDSSANRKRLNGTSAVLKNNSPGVIYVASEENPAMPVEYCLALNPGESVTIPLNGDPTIDDYISAGSFHPNVKLSISYIYA